MTKKIFSEKEIKILSTNPYVKSVTSKGITYTDEFREIFIQKNEGGKLPREIFVEYGFDIDILGMARVRSAGKNWRAAYREKGADGLLDARKENSGKHGVTELTLEEKYARLEVQNNLLKAENELLKKIRAAERGLRINK